MHTFFHGWRRKAGVAALVMACAVTGLWIRSVVSPTTIITAPVNVGQLRWQDVFEISRIGYRYERYEFTLHSRDYGQGLGHCPMFIFTGASASTNKAIGDGGHVALILVNTKFSETCGFGVASVLSLISLLYSA